MSNALDAYLHAPASLRAFDAESLAQAMLDYEAALARALADAGHLGAPEATAIASLCQTALYDLGAWLAAARLAGHLASPLVQELRQTVALYRREAAPLVHLGATDDELLDTAVLLCTARALDATTAVLGPWLDTGAANDAEGAHKAAVRRGLQRLGALRPLALTVRWGEGLTPTPHTLPASGTAAVAERLAGHLGMGAQADTRLADEQTDRLLLEATLLARELGRGLTDPRCEEARHAAAQALEQATGHLAAMPRGVTRHGAWCRTFQALLTAATAAAQAPPA